MWDDQPTHDQAYSKLLPRIHDGAIVLLHSTSRTNAEILDDLLTKWEGMGYTFASLNELPGSEHTAQAGQTLSCSSGFSHSLLSCFMPLQVVIDPQNRRGRRSSEVKPLIPTCSGKNKKARNRCGFRASYGCGSRDLNL